MTKVLLWELGTEEIPARFLPDLIQQITRLAGAGLRENGLGYEKLRVMATPRRLTLLVEGLDDGVFVQPLVKMEARGAAKAPDTPPAEPQAEEAKEENHEH